MPPPRKEESIPSTSEWIAQFTRGFDKSLRNLGIPEKQQIVAQLQSFVRDVQQNRTTKELRETWDYKAIQGTQAKNMTLCRSSRCGIIESC
jgi:predicted outer membrane protein